MQQLLRRETIRPAMVVLVFLLLAAGIWVLSEKLARQRVEQNAVAEMAETLQHKVSHLRQMVGIVSENMAGVASAPIFEHYVEASDGAKGDDYMKHPQVQLAEWFAVLVQNRPFLRQVRLLDADGMELVRVHSDNGRPRIVPQAQLQSKAGRDYVVDTVKLPTQAVSISAITLNREYGQIETPEWAAIRFSMPIFSKHGEVFGVLVLNVHAAALLYAGDEVEHLLGFDEYVLNERGDFLVHPDPGVAFAFEHGPPILWQDLYPAGEHVNGSQSTAAHRYIREDGVTLAVRQPVRLGENDHAKLQLVVAMGPEAHGAAIASLRSEYLKLGLGALCIPMLLCLYLISVARQKDRLGAVNADYRRIIDRTLAGFISIRVDGVILGCNRTAENMLLGDGRGSLIGENLFEIMQLENSATLNEKVLGALGYDGGLDDLELDVPLASGSTISLIMNIVRLHTSHPIKDFFAIILIDNSEQVELQRSVERANQNLEQEVKLRTAELERARNLALSANEIKTEFIGNMSHELRTPLHGIFGTLRLLRQDPLNDRQRHRLMLAEESMAELTEVINGILEVSRLEADRLDLEESEISLPTLLHDVAHRFVQKASKKQLELIVDSAGVTSALVLGDAARLSRILSNLVDNGIKFTAQGEVSIFARTVQHGEDEVTLECTVSDTGIGMSASDLSGLFESDGDEDQPKASLGLSIVRQLCHLLGGDLKVESKPGSGSRFTFHLRLQLATEIADADDKLEQILGRAVAVIDTHAATATATFKLLEQLGAQPTLVDDFAQLDRAQLEFLVIDIAGYLLHQTRIEQWLQRPSTGHAPMVFVTAVINDEALSIQESFSENVYLLDKPVTRVGLEATLLATEGVPRHFAGQSDELDEEQSRRIWGLLPNLSVLVVDDNLVNQKVIGGILEEYGTRISYAFDGQEAIDLLKKMHALQFDVIVMDCQMPVMDGYEATRRIRAGIAGADYVSIPILAVTAGALGGDRRKCIASGMNDYLTKPIRPYELERKLMAMDFASGVLPERGTAGHAIDDPVDNDKGTLASEVNIELRKRLQWDKEDVKNRVMGKMEIVNTIMEIYRKTAPDLLRALDEALVEQDCKKLRNISHELKGVSDNLGAKKVAYLAYEIEMAALDRRLDEIEFLLEQLKLNFDKLIAIFEQENVAAS